MEVNMTEAGGGGVRSSSIRGYFDNWHRSVQYEPWFIKLSTIDRRILWTIFISIFLLLLIIIIAAVSSGSFWHIFLFVYTKCLQLQAAHLIATTVMECVTLTEDFIEDN